jgi:hypothetical protein
MKLQLCSVFLVFFLVSSLSAQKNIGRTWAEGRLTWQDFTIRENAQGKSELRYFFTYNTGRQRFGDTTVVRFFAISYLDPHASWVNPDFKTDQVLRYNQVVFDILEMNRRKLQYEFDRVISPISLDRKLRQAIKLAKDEIEKFNLETDDGLNMDVIMFWEQKLSKQLEKLPDRKIPEFEVQNFGYGMHAGIGLGAFTGSLGGHFKPSFNFLFGFDFAFKNSTIFMNGTLAWNRVRTNYFSEVNWHAGRPAYIAIVDFSYGYALINNHNLKLSPFVGLGITEFSDQTGENTLNKIRMADHSVIFGLNVDYKLRTRINIHPLLFMSAREQVVGSVRARLYVTRARYFDDLRGYTINLTLGFSGFGNLIRLQ